MDKFKELIAAAHACPYQTWAAFTDDSGSKPHTNIVSFTGQTECVLSLPGLHKKDPIVAYLWAAQPDAVRGVAEERAAFLEALVRITRVMRGDHHDSLMTATNRLNAVIDIANEAIKATGSEAA